MFKKYKNKIFWKIVLVLFVVGLFGFSAIANENSNYGWITSISIKKLTANLFTDKSTEDPNKQILIGETIPDELKNTSLIKEKLEFKPFEENKRKTTAQQKQISITQTDIENLDLKSISEGLEKAEALAKEIQTALNQLEEKGNGQTDINDLPQDVDIFEIPTNDNPTPNSPVGLIQLY